MHRRSPRGQIATLSPARLEMGKRARKRRQGLRHRIFKAWVEAVKTA